MRFALPLIATLLFASVLPALAQKRLRDPFAHGRAATAGVPTTIGASADEWKPELRAIMFDHTRSLVNLGGKVLALGEAAGGYRLIGASERAATFLKDGQQITLKLDKEKSP